MNVKQELQKDFQRLQRALRELRFLRYSYMGDSDKRKRVEEAIHLLGPLSDELKEALDKMTRPEGDYDI